MRNKITVILTIMIFGFSILNICNLYLIKRNAFEKLDLAQSYLNDKNYLKAADTARELFDSWKESEKVMKLFCRRNHIDEAADTLAELSAYAEEQNDAMFSAIAEKAKNRIDHIWSSEIPTFDTLL